MSIARDIGPELKSRSGQVNVCFRSGAYVCMTYHSLYEKLFLPYVIPSTVFHHQLVFVLSASAATFESAPVDAWTSVGFAAGTARPVPDRATTGSLLLARCVPLLAAEVSACRLLELTASYTTTR